MEWLSANWGNLLVGAVLLAIVIGIVINLIRRKRNGCDCGCGCGCADCPSHKK
ncbi:MAG: FeoB-associated Cys-rich membrane protein [Victivallales bacterium]|nr:FeoB-associated Cys-rich membrane protein [Victivallales bacterium]